MRRRTSLRNPEPKTTLLYSLLLLQVLLFFFLDFFSSTHLACICICICKNVTTFAYDSHVVRSGQVRLGVRLLGREGRVGKVEKVGKVLDN